MSGNDTNTVRQPCLAALIPAWNPREGLMETLRSISAQPVECVIFVVDDGSEPPIELPARMGRMPIRVIRQDPNRGISAALNTGLRTILAQSFEFVARNDCSDIDHVDRLSLQLAYLRENPDVVLVGSSVRFDTPNHGMQYTFVAPETKAQIKKKMHYSAAIVHSSCMFRTEAFRQSGLYSGKYPHAEDYDLFFRLLKDNREIRNLPETLVTAAYNPGSVSMSNRRISLMSRLKLQLKYFDPLFAHSYLGILQTLGLWLTPYRLVCMLKAKPLARNRS
ncbi:glycosyltransferase [Salinisphaera aquimarina]|uniref:Glycosyltransferase n=1 Tax=Salinisphaera aquimarina TaxID=2094031 RepID=A0ABV7EN22_9GAMM